MFAKLALLFVAVAAVNAGYLQPAVRTYVQHAPIAIPQPPLTYSVPPVSRAEHLPPVVSSSYGFSTSHIPGPAPIIRSHPVAAPLAIAAAPVPVLGSGLGLARGFVGGYGLGGHYSSGLGLAGGYALGGHLASAPLVGRSYTAGIATPALGYAGNIGLGPIGYGRGYAW